MTASGSRRRQTLRHTHALFALHHVFIQHQRQPAQHRRHAHRRGLLRADGRGAQDPLCAIPCGADRIPEGPDGTAPGADLHRLARRLAHHAARALADGAGVFPNGVPMHWMRDWPMPHLPLVAKAYLHLLL